MAGCFPGVRDGRKDEGSILQHNSLWPHSSFETVILSELCGKMQPSSFLTSLTILSPPSPFPFITWLDSFIDFILRKLRRSVIIIEGLEDHSKKILFSFLCLSSANYSMLPTPDTGHLKKPEFRDVYEPAGK